jgi:hypothetical protein
MIRLLLVFLVCCHALLAAEEESSGKKTLLRFTSFGLEAGGGEYVIAAGESQSAPFAVPDNGFSEPVAVPGAGAVLGFGKPGGEPFKSLATIKLPEEGKRFLVIVFPGNAADTLRTLVVRADDPAFRPGQVMIINLAKQVLAADLGGEKLRFEPGSQTIFRPRRKDDLANYQVRFYQDKEGRAKLFAANLWPYFDNKRAFVFLHADPATGSPTYRSIDEFTDWLRDGS